MESRDWIGPREIAEILRVTDEMGLHREAVRVPLDCEDPSRVEIQARVLLVIAPKSGPMEPFLAGLPDRVKALPGAHLLKRADAPPLQ